MKKVANFFNGIVNLPKNIWNFICNIILVSELAGYMIAHAISYFWEKYNLAKPLMIIGAINGMIMTLLAALYLLSFIAGEMTDGARLAIYYFSHSLYLIPLFITSLLATTVWRKQLGQNILELGNAWFRNPEESY